MQDDDMFSGIGPLYSIPAVIPLTPPVAKVEAAPVVVVKNMSIFTTVFVVIILIVLVYFIWMLYSRVTVLTNQSLGKVLPGITETSLLPEMRNQKFTQFAPAYEAQEEPVKKIVSFQPSYENDVISAPGPYPTWSDDLDDLPEAVKISENDPSLLEKIKQREQFTKEIENQMAAQNNES